MRGDTANPLSSTTLPPQAGQQTHSILQPKYPPSCAPASRRWKFRLLFLTCHP